ncbi:sigma-54 interaction domain-containing protein [Sporomusa acidovorans]|uniref:Anaerobic nitric oxide reductase transcription regulator NorR n=1 Tax=Sporomusa acidovorans (strain ATCC 49682 / DSM 3132 / Mol) TaxID=1123286 RepID=A0ABZ3J251_SPOA4|nr:sigma 54-interacting transcriptional regulator [Sporomusa acidovorans]OZC19954.1 arginine utilization regulatory protein RocR [Sporomusa acidovorans DSM 3132]SDD49142.1 regulatory protein, Fis family [Sporomusa acidovorans]
MKSQDLLQHLFAMLPVIARISGGFATITDANGHRLKTVDSTGKEEANCIGQVYDLALKAAQMELPVCGESQFIKEAEAWAVAIGEYVIACSNIERVERDKKLLESLSNALPLIARVAGGEAVLFDKLGRRLDSVDHNGVHKNKFNGKVSESAYEAMATQTPIIGASISVPGAMAVRIPITKAYGLGFNNEVFVSQKHKLVDEMKKYQYARYTFDDIIGESDSIRRCKNMARYIAQNISSVLIHGETGTGKELFAQAIHNVSDRRDQPFVAINCSALPASLIEGNLFGYVEGSFTGAKKGGSPGIFEGANHGTVFLDEISEMNLDLQVKLLRVIQEREVTRIGSTKSIPIDVRIICATNKNLRRLIEEKTFREDLFYRINVVELRIPPLRDRAKDVILLAKYFMKKYNQVLGKYIAKISPEVADIFCCYRWPGNVRELQNCIESALNMARVGDKALTVSLLPSQFHSTQYFTNPTTAKRADVNLRIALRNAEKQIITGVLQEENGNRTQAAKRLGVSITTLWRRMKDLGLQD